jgi:hypothetical protein
MSATRATGSARRRDGTAFAANGEVTQGAARDAATAPPQRNTGTRLEMPTR